MKSLIKLRPGIVDEVYEKKIKVTLNKKDMKSICAEKGCNICKHDFPPTVMYIPRNGLEIKKGDYVTVSTVVLNEAVGAFIAFIFPLICAVLFFYFAISVLHWEENSGKIVLGTLLSLLSALFSLTGIDKAIRLIAPPKVTNVEQNS